MHKKLFLSVSAAAVVSLFTACGGDENTNTASENQNGAAETEQTQEETEENQNQTAENSEGNQNQATENSGEEAEGNSSAAGNAEAPEMPEPELDDVPDVVAEVNDSEISKEEFETAYQGMFMQASQQTQMTGEEVDQDQLKQDAAESLVQNELLEQEADNQEINVSDEEVDETLTELAEQNGMESSDDLLAALEQQGTGEEEVRSEVETQVKMEELIASEAGDIEVTDEEVQEMYDQMTEQQEQMAGSEGGETELPALEEVRPEIENQIESQKQAEHAQELVADLREDADVTIHL